MHPGAAARRCAHVCAHAYRSDSQACSSALDRQEIVFTKSHDNILRQLAKAGNPEELLVFERMKDKWEGIRHALMEERVHAQVTTFLDACDEAAADNADSAAETSLLALRSGPGSFEKDSPSYWMSTANMTVRMLVSLATEPATVAHLSTIVKQSHLKARDDRKPVRAARSLRIATRRPCTAQGGALSLIHI